MGYIENYSWNTTPQSIARECRESKPRYIKYVNNMGKIKQL